MDPRVDFVEDVLGFRFENGFRAKFLELGAPVDDLEFWFRSAQVFVELDRVRPISQAARDDVLTLIETIQLDARVGYPPPDGIEDLIFDTSAYKFSKEIESYKAQVISLVIAQQGANNSGVVKN